MAPAGVAAMSRARTMLERTGRIRSGSLAASAFEERQEVAVGVDGVELPRAPLRGAHALGRRAVEHAGRLQLVVELVDAAHLDPAAGRSRDERLSSGAHRL